jgi:Fe-S-cluster containining protein
MKPARKYDAAWAALDAIYAALPRVACQGRCAITCGPIPLTDLEARRLHTTTHTKPRTIPVDEVDAQGNTRRQRCVYLTPRDRCGAYGVRPLICRVFGVLKSLSCMHGCVPDRWLTDEEFLRIAQAVERVIVTTPEGLVIAEGEAFGGIVPTRDPAAVAENAERTRSLRALHGGRIMAAVREDR